MEVAPLVAKEKKIFLRLLVIISRALNFYNYNIINYFIILLLIYKATKLLKAKDKLGLYKAI